MAQLTVYIFVAALNNQNEDMASTAAKTPISGSKRLVEWDYLSAPGFSYPPPKKMALAEDELGLVMLPSNSSNILLIEQ